MAWKSSHRFARIAPRKAKLVVDLVRGMDAGQALDLLKFTNKRAAVFVDKILRAAIASADEAAADTNELFISEARVDQGPTLKRGRAKDRGRYHVILKRTSHITVVVEQRTASRARA